jgi:hypothetical protein
MNKLKEFIANNGLPILVVLTIIMILFMVSSANASSEGHSHHEGCGHEQPRPQNTNNSTNNRITTTTAGADSNANAGANAVSNSGGNNLSASGGESTSSATASGGTSTATGGVSGDSTNEITIGGDNHEMVANSAASIFAGYCQTGSSGQIDKGGFSVLQTEQFCNYLRLANVMYQAYERELSHCSCVGVCTRAEASVRMECAESGQADKFLEAYYENLWDAQSLVQSSEGTAKLDRWSKHLSTPMALIGALIWLL